MNDRDATSGSAGLVPAETAEDVSADDVSSGDVSSEDVSPDDVLPEDLQPALADHEDYVFPNNNRRRIPGYLYLGVAVVLVVLYLAFRDSPYVNGGYLFAAVLLGAFGAYSIVSGWNLDVDERDALVASVDRVGFPVGHASAQMGWRGLLSRPTWRILLYSADEPPSKRGFVLVDGVDGEVVEALVEDNPEDWSEFADDPDDPEAAEPAAISAGDEADETDDTGNPADPGRTPGSGTV
ncbi:MAG: hypothetical protein ACK5PP_11215 [Acidimicrobiales bacterium]